MTNEQRAFELRTQPVERVHLELDLSAIGAATTPDELERRGVRRLREFKASDVRRLVESTVDRVLAERAEGRADRNAVIEDTTSLLESDADLDPATRITLLERRLEKLARALDRSESALAEVLEDVDTGLPAARGYVSALPDDHPLRRRSEELLGTLMNGRGRSMRAEPTLEETRRANERRALLATLAELNQIDRTPLEAPVEAPVVTQVGATIPIEPAPRPAKKADEGKRSFADLTADELRLDTRDVRPFRAHGGTKLGR